MGSAPLAQLCRTGLKPVDSLSCGGFETLGFVFGVMPAALTAKGSEMREVDMTWMILHF